MTQPPDDAALVARLRKRLAEAPPLAWAYRPEKYDDWGMIRGPVRDDLSIGPFRPIVARGHDSMVSEADMSAHRAAKTDPYGPSSLLIVDAVNALPGLLDALEAKDRRIAEMRQALEDVCDPLGYLRRMAEADGARLAGMAYAIANDIATVQRIARAALEPSDKGVGR